MIEVMICRLCHVGDYPQNLNVMLIHPDGRNEPHTEGPLCDGCVEARRAEIDGEGGAGTVREVRKLERAQ